MMTSGIRLRLAALAAVLVTSGAAYGFAVRDDGAGAVKEAASVEALDVYWDDLLPEQSTAAVATGVVEHQPNDDSGSPWQEMTDVSAVRTDLDGKTVRIPGYMTPLSFDDAEVGEFLLVPYVGACVHVPPPAANQIVYVRVDGTVPVLEMWEPFAAVGTLRTEPQSTELAEVGYTMELSHLEVYEEEDVQVFDDAGNPVDY